jgi:hypothetical protein
MLFSKPNFLHLLFHPSSPLLITFHLPINSFQSSPFPTHFSFEIICTPPIFLIQYTLLHTSFHLYIYSNLNKRAHCKPFLVSDTFLRVLYCIRLLYICLFVLYTLLFPSAMQLSLPTIHLFYLLYTVFNLLYLHRSPHTVYLFPPTVLRPPPIVDLSTTVQTECTPFSTNSTPVSTYYTSVYTVCEPASPNLPPHASLNTYCRQPSNISLHRSTSHIKPCHSSLHPNPVLPSTLFIHLPLIPSIQLLRPPKDPLHSCFPPPSNPPPPPPHG